MRVRVLREASKRREQEMMGKGRGGANRATSDEAECVEREETVSKEKLTITSI
jgi:hypothetical protein